MCGIVGILSANKGLINQQTIERLKLLEYRGYDSFGYVDENLTPRKYVGAISRTAIDHRDLQVENTLTIAHTRWATHGKVTSLNAHPHTSMCGNFAVVHNGVVSNYKDLRQSLTRFGYTFSSSTDTEVIPNLIAAEFKTDPTAAPQTIVRRAIYQIEGEFAFLVISKHWPDRIVCVKNKSPLVVGLRAQMSAVASDETALSPDFKECVHLNDMEILTLIREEGHTYATLSDSKDFTGRFTPIAVQHQDVGKGAFPDYMSKEMSEIPKVIDRANHVEIDPARFRNQRILLSGCGSAYYAAWIGQMIRMSIDPESDTTAHPADELLTSLNPNVFDTAIFVSQSGETYDVINPLSKISKNVSTACVTNVKGSTLARLTDLPVIQNAGPERCVLSTKSIISQCAILYRMFGGSRASLAQVANAWSTVFQNAGFAAQLKSLAEENVWIDHYFHIGRGILHPVAMENALKLKEVTYCHAEGMGAGFFKHGTLSLIDDRFIVFAHLPSKTLQPELYDLTEANIAEIESRSGKVIRVGHEADHDFTLPDIDRELNALFHLGFGQHYAYHKARILDRDVDQPRSLAKSVTVR